MTGLERLGEWLRGEMLDPWADIIDAHLKEDEERAKELHQAKAEWFEEKKRALETEAQLAELRAKYDYRGEDS